MNAVELYARLDFYVDRVRSVRYDDTDRATAINIAIEKIIDDRYDNFKQRRRYSFQSIQAIRDQLYPLVKTTAPIVPTNNIFPFPADYRHEVGFTINVDGTSWASKAVTYTELNELKDYSFANPIAEEPAHYEDQNGVNIYLTGAGTVVDATMNYIKNPAVVSVSSTSITAGPSVLTVGQTYYVTLGPVTHNSIIYQTGDTFVAVNTILIGVGTVVLIVNSDLPAALHDEICSTGAQILLGIAEAYNKKQNMKEESGRT